VPGDGLHCVPGLEEAFMKSIKLLIPALVIPFLALGCKAPGTAETSTRPRANLEPHRPSSSVDPVFANGGGS
jgi:hypothetical protein